MNLPRRFALILPLLLAANLTNASGDAALSGALDCTPSNTSGAMWTVELDERIPIAVVSDEDKPADYSPTHVRIMLTPEGSTMTIGRSSGRYLASTATGELLGQGRCQPHATA